MISDGERLPFRTESFDVVYSNGVLHHTPDTAGAIREVHRVLRPGGTAKVMLYHRNSLNYWIEIVLRRGLLGLSFCVGDLRKK
jgi:ubiquinone/menaquinone biosynthesis C-methylase UbiE